MFLIGLIREGKIPPDNRVALTPAQCKWIQQNLQQVKVLVQPSVNRCYTNQEYKNHGIELSEDLTGCNLLIGIKEVPFQQLIKGKQYMFFSHTKKKQAHNQVLFQTIIYNKITLIDFECLEHEDGQRIIGFGFFAGIVGAHNGIMAFGARTGAFELPRVYKSKDYRELIKAYFGLKLPNIKIVVAGSGRVATGVLEIMNLMDVKEVEPDEYLAKVFQYPVFVHLKGPDLYQHKITGNYNRDDFHNNPQNYNSKFKPYLSETDILMNGTYWDKNVPCLFKWEDLQSPHFKIQTIADISDDKEGGIPCNLGDSTIEHPVYGVDPVTRKMVAPYQPGCIDVMAVSNLPNELPRDSSNYFGEQLIKYVIRDIVENGSAVIERATMVKNGKLCPRYQYLQDYAQGKSVQTDCK